MHAAVDVVTGVALDALGQGVESGQLQMGIG